MTIVHWINGESASGGARSQPASLAELTPEGE